MEIAEFLSHVKAQLCGGHIIKTFYNDVHTIIAHLVDDNPVLTADGEALKQEVESTVHDAEPIVEEAADAAIASKVADPTLDALADAGINAAISEINKTISPAESDVNKTVMPPPKAPPAKKK
jgi:hypothetical protein